MITSRVLFYSTIVFFFFEKQDLSKFFGLFTLLPSFNAKDNAIFQFQFQFHHVSPVFSPLYSFRFNTIHILDQIEKNCSQQDKFGTIPKRFGFVFRNDIGALSFRF